MVLRLIVLGRKIRLAQLFRTKMVVDVDQAVYFYICSHVSNSRCLVLG